MSRTPGDQPDIHVTLPRNIATVYQGGLFVLALLAALYVAQDVVLPLLLAFFLKLLLQPVMKWMKQLHVPRLVSALLAMTLLLGAVAGLGSLVNSPASQWAQRLPQGLPRLEQRVRSISRPVENLSRLFKHAKHALVGTGASAPSSGGTDFQQLLLSTMHHVTVSFVWVMLILFFLLVAGDSFLRRLVEVMPTFGDKRQVIDIALQVETDMSAYLTTITVMNTFVGVATGVGMWLLGLPDPLLWGVAAFMLNYVPIFGPLTGMLMFLAVGMLTLDPLWKAFMPMVLYISTHIIEGETVTPMLLARRFTLNPVLVMTSLLFWDWMWGVPGAVLAVPLLAIFKIICERVEPLAALGHFIQGERRRVWEP